MSDMHILGDDGRCIYCHETRRTLSEADASLTDPEEES